MKIGPIDVRNHTFTRKMRGVDENEVRDYQDLVADRLEEFVLENDGRRVEIMDIGPTVLDLFGVDVPEYCDGKSFMPGKQS